MPDYGFGALAIGTGAQAGLQDLLKQRLLERQMALQEQAQRENSAYRQRALEQDASQFDSQLALNAAIAGLREQEREQARTDRQADQLATDLAPGTKMRYGSTVETMRQGGRGDLLKAVPMAMTPADQGEQSIRGLRIGAPDQMGAKPISADFAPGEYEKLPTASQQFQIESSRRAEDASTRAQEALDLQGKRLDAALTRSSQGERRLDMQEERERRTALARMQREWRTAVKQPRELERQAAIMTSGMEQARSGKPGSMGPAQQEVLVTFQKILDPISVVRESEFARSGEAQSLYDEIAGYMTKLSQGGAGMTLQALEAYYTAAMDAAERAANIIYDYEKEPFDAQAEMYGLDPKLIYGQGPVGFRRPQAKGQVQGQKKPNDPLGIR